MKRLTMLGTLCSIYWRPLVGICLFCWLPTSESQAATADAWEQDFRRCRVLKSSPAGTVALNAGDGTVELDVLWPDGKHLDDFKDSTPSVRIDQVRLTRLQPLKADLGILYAYSLGPADPVLRALGGKRFSFSFDDRPERSVEVAIGDGKTAVAFLRKCDAFWIKWRRTHR